MSCSRIIRTLGTVPSPAREPGTGPARKRSLTSDLPVFRALTRRPTLEFVFDNGLTVADSERLAFVGEECAEAIRIVGKILCYRWESHDPTRPVPTNRRMLETELGNIRFAMASQAEAGDLSNENIRAASLGRVADPGRYIHRQGERPRQEVGVAPYLRKILGEATEVRKGEMPTLAEQTVAGRPVAVGPGNTPHRS